MQESDESIIQNSDIVLCHSASRLSRQREPELRVPRQVTDSVGKRHAIAFRDEVTVQAVCDQFRDAAVKRTDDRHSHRHSLAKDIGYPFLVAIRGPNTGSEQDIGTVERFPYLSMGAPAHQPYSRGKLQLRH